MKYEKELYQEIFVFLISYNYRIIKFYNYYSIINKKFIFYYYLIYEFNFIELNGKKNRQYINLLIIFTTNRY
jgi:hypothetical protein